MIPASSYVYMKVNSHIWTYEIITYMHMPAIRITNEQSSNQTSG